MFGSMTMDSLKPPNADGEFVDTEHDDASEARPLPDWVVTFAAEESDERAVIVAEMSTASRFLEQDADAALMGQRRAHTCRLCCRWLGLTYNTSQGHYTDERTDLHRRQRAKNRKPSYLVCVSCSDFPFLCYACFRMLHMEAPCVVPNIDAAFEELNRREEAAASRSGASDCSSRAESPLSMEPPDDSSVSVLHNSTPTTMAAATTTSHLPPHGMKRAGLAIVAVSGRVPTGHQHRPLSPTAGFGSLGTFHSLTAHVAVELSTLDPAVASCCRRELRQRTQSLLFAEHFAPPLPDAPTTSHATPDDDYATTTATAADDHPHLSRRPSSAALQAQHSSCLVGGESIACAVSLEVLTSREEERRHEIEALWLADRLVTQEVVVGVSIVWSDNMNASATTDPNPNDTLSPDHRSVDSSSLMSPESPTDAHGASNPIAHLVPLLTLTRPEDDEGSQKGEDRHADKTHAAGAKVGELQAGLFGDEAAVTLQALSARPSQKEQAAAAVQEVDDCGASPSAVSSAASHSLAAPPVCVTIDCFWVPMQVEAMDTMSSLVQQDEARERRFVEMSFEQALDRIAATSVAQATMSRITLSAIAMGMEREVAQACSTWFDEEWVKPLTAACEELIVRGVHRVLDGTTLWESGALDDDMTDDDGVPMTLRWLRLFHAEAIERQRGWVEQESEWIPLCAAMHAREQQAHRFFFARSMLQNHHFQGQQLQRQYFVALLTTLSLKWLEFMELQLERGSRRIDQLMFQCNHMVTRQWMADDERRIRTVYRLESAQSRLRAREAQLRRTFQADVWTFLMREWTTAEKLHRFSLERTFVLLYRDVLREFWRVTRMDLPTLLRNTSHVFEICLSDWVRRVLAKETGYFSFSRDKALCAPSSPASVQANAAGWVAASETAQIKVSGHLVEGVDVTSRDSEDESDLSAEITDAKQRWAIDTTITPMQPPRSVDPASIPVALALYGTGTVTGRCGAATVECFVWPPDGSRRMSLFWDPVFGPSRRRQLGTAATQQESAQQGPPARALRGSNARHRTGARRATDDATVMGASVSSNGSLRIGGGRGTGSGSGDDGSQPLLTCLSLLSSLTDVPSFTGTAPFTCVSLIEDEACWTSVCRVGHALVDNFSECGAFDELFGIYDETVLAESEEKWLNLVTSRENARLQQMEQQYGASAVRRAAAAVVASRSAAANASRRRKRGGGSSASDTASSVMSEDRTAASSVAGRSVSTTGSHKTSSQASTLGPAGRATMDGGGDVSSIVAALTTSCGSNVSTAAHTGDPLPEALVAHVFGGCRPADAAMARLPNYAVPQGFFGSRFLFGTSHRWFRNVWLPPATAADPQLSKTQHLFPSVWDTVEEGRDPCDTGLWGPDGDHVFTSGLPDESGAGSASRKDRRHQTAKHDDENASNAAGDDAEVTSDFTDGAVAASRRMRGAYQEATAASAAKKSEKRDDYVKVVASVEAEHHARVQQSNRSFWASTREKLEEARRQAAEEAKQGQQQLSRFPSRMGSFFGSGSRSPSHSYAAGGSDPSSDFLESASSPSSSKRLRQRAAPVSLLSPSLLREDVSGGVVSRGGSNASKGSGGAPTSTRRDDSVASPLSTKRSMASPASFGAAPPRSTRRLPAVVMKDAFDMLDD